MSKANKKLQTEITNSLKQVDEGIAQLEVLEQKVENASTISIKEKYRADMKREIKRLQRLRDIFRQNVNNPAIVEQHKLVEARKRIETEMEKFRDHEKEYKSKKPTKAAMLNETEIKGKFNFGSGSEFEEDYDGEEENGELSEEDEDLDDGPQDIMLDKQWLSNFVAETLKTLIGKYDSELDKIQNKKTKGGQKKNRDKINALKAKKSHLQHIKDRAEELQISMDYLEAGKIRQLRSFSKQMVHNSDEESTRLNTLQEIDNLIEVSELSRRSIHDPNKSSSNLNGAHQSDQHQVIEQLGLHQNDDIIKDDRDLLELRTGNILDAQDYLGSWHLSIVITDPSNGDADSRTLHFLPFSKANRDEQFSKDDQERIAPAFSKYEAVGEPHVAITTLYEYLDKHLKKTGQAALVLGGTKGNKSGPSSLAEESKGNSRQNTNQRDRMNTSESTADTTKNNDTHNSRSGATAQQQTQQHASLQLQKGKHHNNKLSQVPVGSGSSQSSLMTSADDLHSGSKQQQNSRRALAGRDAIQQDQADEAVSSRQEEQMMGQGSMGRSLPNQATDKAAQSSDVNAAEAMGRANTNAGAGLMAPMFTNSFGALGGHSPLGQPLSEPKLPQPLDQRQLHSQNSDPASVLLQGGLGLSQLGGQMSQSPTLVKDTTSSERKHNLDLLETSFGNILTKQDQEVIDPKHPMSVWEEHDFPRVPLFNRKENFSNFDLETLFFAFYYQQGTHQQYLAAVELKKKNWKFVKKFETWFKKVESTSGSSDSTATPANTSQSQALNSGSSVTPGNNPTNSDGVGSGAAAGSAQKDVGKYIFFDFENGWQQLVRDDFELDLSQIENELIVQPAATSAAPITPAGNSATGHAGHTGTPAAATTSQPSSSGAPQRTSHTQ